MEMVVTRVRGDGELFVAPGAKSLEDKLEPGGTALLVVDMLNDFLHPDGKAASRASRPIGKARAAIGVMRGLMDAADRHGVLIVMVNHLTLADGSSGSPAWWDARSRAAYSLPDICLEGTWGARVIDELTPSEHALEVRKYRYSGFAGTNLDMALRSRGIATLVCAGVSTNACVEATAREAFSHDYFVVYPSNGCASWDQSLHDATLRTAANRYAEVVTAQEIMDVWDRA